MLIPDFGFEKEGLKVYLEVVGFWTPDYLERKIRKLSSIAGVDMIIVATLRASPAPSSNGSKKRRW